MRAALLQRLQAIRALRRPVALVTDLATGMQCLVHNAMVEGDFGPTEHALHTVQQWLLVDRSGLLANPEDDETAPLFVRSYTPSLRLLVVGAVHIAQSLVPMAVALGYAVTVIDPRTAFATPERFPGMVLDTRWPDTALTALAPDFRTAIVILSHDAKLDDPALVTALASPAFYVGALGSHRTHGRRLERLRAAGLEEAALARIHGPVGLDIGALTPAEIAVSILAEMTAIRYGKLAGHREAPHGST